MVCFNVMVYCGETPHFRFHSHKHEAEALAHVHTHTRTKQTFRPCITSLTPKYDPHAPFLSTINHVTTGCLCGCLMLVHKQSKNLFSTDNVRAHFDCSDFFWQRIGARDLCVLCCTVPATPSSPPRQHVRVMARFWLFFIFACVSALCIGSRASAGFCVVTPPKPSHDPIHTHSKDPTSETGPTAHKTKNTAPTNATDW